MTCYLTIFLSCFLADERELQERLNRGVELDEKAEQLKNELQKALQNALVAIDNATMSTITPIIQEGQELLRNMKAVALNISRQGESAVVTHTH